MENQLDVLIEMRAELTRLNDTCTRMETKCDRMETHINFIERVYDRFRTSASSLKFSLFNIPKVINQWITESTDEPPVTSTNEPSTNEPSTNEMLDLI